MRSLPDIGRDYSLHVANCSEYDKKICCLITELSANLEVEHVTTKNNYLDNFPEIWVTVKNYGNRTAMIYNATLETGKNYVVVQMPEYIPPNSIETFIFRFEKALCSEYNSRIDYLMKVAYKKNDDETNTLYKTGNFYVLNPIALSSDSGIVGININDMLRIPLTVKNLGTKKFNYGMTITTTDIFMTLERYGEVYTKEEANSALFPLDVVDTSNLILIAPFMLEESVTVNVQHSSCSYANQTATFIVKSLTNTGGVINIAVSPDIGYVLPVLLGLIGAFLFVRFRN